MDLGASECISSSHSRGQQFCKLATKLRPSSLLQGTRTRCQAAEQRCQELQSSLRKLDAEKAQLQAQLQVLPSCVWPMSAPSLVAGSRARVGIPSCCVHAGQRRLIIVA